jgi:hypothetical protein
MEPVQSPQQPPEVVSNPTPEEITPTVSPEDYISQLTLGDKKPSADTLVDQQTGEQQQPDSVAKPAPVRPKMDATEAKSKTERFLKFRDFLQSRGLAWGAGDMDKYEEFAMQEWEFAMLADVYNDVILSMGYIPKWFDIAIAEIMVLAPRIVKVFNHRKLQKKVVQLEAKIKAMESKANNHFQTAADPNADFRTDLKKWWQVDNEGFFMYDKGGYVTKENKKDKPDVSDPQQYELAIKYNGKEKIDRIFNIQA